MLRLHSVLLLVRTNLSFSGYGDVYGDVINWRCWEDVDWHGDM